MSSKVRIGIASGLATLACLAPVTGTAGAQMTVGQTVGAPYELVPCFSSSPEDVVQISVAAGTGYAMPTTGVLTSWSTNAGPAPGQIMGLRVYRPLGGLTFQVVGENGPRALLAGQRNVFPVAIPVQAGDILGLFVPSNGNAECLFGQTGHGADFYRYDQSSPPNGAVFSFSPGLFGTEERANIEASLLPPPAIVSLSPATGPITNAVVTIVGANFATVQGVSFGGVPAKSFVVDSEGQISAVAPDSASLGQVLVAVTTVAGTATSAQSFTYEGCKVPKLKGRKLKASKKKARKSDCRIGKVKKRGDATAKTGKVVKQNPKPGRILLPGTRIKLTLGD